MYNSRKQYKSIILINYFKIFITHILCAYIVNALSGKFSMNIPSEHNLLLKT